MKPPESLETPVEPGEAPPPVIYYPPTPLSWRLAILSGIVAIGVAAYLARDSVGLRGQSLAGIFFFFGIVAAFSSNLRAVNWRTIGWGIALQVLLAVAVLRVPNSFIKLSRARESSSPFHRFFDGRREVRVRQHGRPATAGAGGTWSPLFPGQGNWWFQFALRGLAADPVRLGIFHGACITSAFCNSSSARSRKSWCT